MTVAVKDNNYTNCSCHPSYSLELVIEFSE